jgi:hypothetical protein
MNRMHRLARWVAGSAQDTVPRPGDVPLAEEPFSPYAGRLFPTQVLWGDTHLHTAP